MAIKKIDFFGRFEPPPADESTARRFRALAGVAEQVSEIAGTFAQRQLDVRVESAKQAGLKAGEIAGLKAAETGVFEPRDSGAVVYDEAYNAALESAYLAQVSNDARNEIDRVAIEAPDDVQSFLQLAGKARAGILEGADDRFAEVIDATISNFIEAKKNRVFSAEKAKNRNMANEARTAEINQALISTAQYAREGDKTQALANLAQAEVTIDSMVATGDLATDKAEEMKRAGRREMVEQEYKFELDSLVESDGFNAAYKRLSEFERPESFTPDEWTAFQSAASSELSRANSIRDASKAVNDKDIQQSIKQYSQAVSLGFDVDPEEKARVQGLVSGTDYQKDFDRVNRVAGFSVMSAKARNDALQQAQTGKLADIEDYKALLTANDEINKLAQKDPFRLGVQQGLITQDPLDIQNPQSFGKRIEQAKILSQHYGLPVPVMTSEEAETFSKQIDQMTPEEKVNTAVTLNQAPETWGLLASKNQAAFSMAGATGDRDLMSRVFSGQEKIKSGLIEAPKKSEYLASFDDYVGDVYGLKDKAAVLQAAVAYYSDTQVPGEMFDAGLFEEAVEAVTGGIDTYNGFKIALPRGISNDDFETYIDGIDADYIDSIGGVTGYTSNQAVRAIRDGRLISVGDNQYVVSVNGSQVLMSKDGNPLMLSYEEEVVAKAQSESFFKRQSTSEILGEAIREQRIR
jgi:hypothetical protein